MKHLFSLPALAAAAVLGFGTAANATVFIGLQQDAGAIVTVASGATPAIPLNAGLSFGNFEGVSVSAVGQPGTVLPILLQTSNTVVNNVANIDGRANAGTLTIYVTSTGNTGLPGNAMFTSGFSSTNLTGSWTETLETYLDPGNGIYALTTLLGSASFSATQAETDIAIAPPGDGLYSVTAVFKITAPTLSSLDSGASVKDAAIVPEPASLALLGGALVGFGIYARRRRPAAI